MNEFVDPSQQPTDDPRRRSAVWFPKSDDPPPSGLPPPPLGADDSPAVPARGSPPVLPREVLVVRDGGTGEVAGARVWGTNGQTDRSVRPTGTFEAKVRQAFAEILAEDIVAAVWPVPSTDMSPLANKAKMLRLAEELLDPQILAGKLVEATVQLAAVHAGIPLPVARAVGQAARELFLSSVQTDPDTPDVQAVRYADLTLCAEDGSVLDSPALLQIAVGETADEINELLGPDDLPPVPLESASPVREKPSSVREKPFTLRLEPRPVRPKPPPDDGPGMGI